MLAYLRCALMMRAPRLPRRATIGLTPAGEKALTSTSMVPSRSGAGTRSVVKLPIRGSRRCLSKA
jgi:hypothetical protein